MSGRCDSPVKSPPGIRLHRLAGPLWAHGPRPEPPNDALRRATELNGSVKFSRERPLVVEWACDDHGEGLTGLRDFGDCESAERRGKAQKPVAPWATQNRLSAR
jgi:hypothetical protein